MRTQKRSYLPHEYYYLPNFDANDKYILNFRDLEKKNIIKISKFLNKYNREDGLVVVVTKNTNRVEYEINYINNKKIHNIETIYSDSIDYLNLFSVLKELSINQWKKINKIQNDKIYNLTCEVNFFNLTELSSLLLTIEVFTLAK